MRIAVIALILGSVFGAVLADEAPMRWIPERCRSDASVSDDANADSRWNEAYRQGLLAIQEGQFLQAESSMCLALRAARRFDPRDWRFSETLDELGLIAFELRDFELAEQVQGAAIAEMLLAVGPHGEPLGDADLSRNKHIREDCRSGVRVYTTRLGWIHEQLRGRISIDTLNEEPWRIFAVGYLPLDVQLAKRLDWLIAQYLLLEDVAAADALAELQHEIILGAKTR
jgi:hypothetical protein